MTDHNALKYEPQPWLADAACRGLDVNLFYPERFSGQPAARAAKEICQTCPVTEECLIEALAVNDVWGIRGGMTPKERRMEGRRRRREGRAA